MQTERTGPGRPAWERGYSSATLNLLDVLARIINSKLMLQYSHDLHGTAWHLSDNIHVTAIA